MNIRFLSGIFLLLTVASVRASEAEPLQQIGENIAAIGTNICSFSESASQLMQSITLTATNIGAGLTGLAARFPKTTIFAAASGLLYVSWRSYDSYCIKHHLDDAKIFLDEDLPRREVPVAGNTVLKIRNLDLYSASRGMIESYLNRINELQLHLRNHSRFADWVDDIQTQCDINDFASRTIALTPDQVAHIEDYINPRIASLGLPQYYQWSESPFIWMARIAAPWHAQSNINPMRSYASGIVGVYEGEATKLTWQLFKWEKQLRARLAQLPA